jgi:hypothetical protein
LDSERIIIFGAGNLGKIAFEYYGERAVDFFCDNNDEKIGQIYCGKKIISFEELKKNNLEYKIVIAVTNFYPIEKQFYQNGIKNYMIFFRENFKCLDTPNLKMLLNNYIERMLALNSSSIMSVFKEFINANIFILKKLNFKTNKNLIAVCVIKNDLEKLKKFLEHHRSLGIRQFAFLDDHSTDGTREYLQEQQDVELFESNDPFFTERKEAWINYILAYYGFNRWYAVLDSDELLVYDNCEICEIDKFIASLEKENIIAVSGKMIDMYFHNEAEYFDKRGYFYDECSHDFPRVTGGMRYRVFEMQMLLSKTPLFLFDDKMVYQIHYLFPFEKNFQKKNTLALLHYKFLAGDLEKYRERVRKKNMYNDSEEYKKYVKKIDDGNLDCYDENISEEYVNSKTLVENGLIEALI